jgi:peptidoglycan/LPS O-acetylase OafA/YrhL
MSRNAVVTTNKFYALEGIRFFAACAVVLQHYRHFLMTGETSWAFLSSFDSRLLPFYRFLAIFYDDRFGAVAIFWILSGFIFCWKYADDVHRGTVGGRLFFTLRLSRLYPLHLVTLLIVALLEALYRAHHGSNFVYGPNDTPHFLQQLVMASNWLQSQPSTFNGPIWSVSAEIAVYFVFFSLARLVRLQFLICVAVALLCWLVGRYIDALDFLRPVIVCAKFFFIGALVERLHALLGARGRRVVFFVLAATIPLGIVAVAVDSIPRSNGIDNKFITLFDAALVLLSVTAEDFFGHTPFAKLARLGELTYSTYLIHFPIELALVIAADALGFSRHIFLQPAVFLSYLTLVVYLGRLTYRRFEIPAQRFIRARMIAPLPQPQMWSARP